MPPPGRLPRGVGAPEQLAEAKLDDGSHLVAMPGGILSKSFLGNSLVVFVGFRVLVGFLFFREYFKQIQEVYYYLLDLLRT